MGKVTVEEVLKLAKSQVGYLEKSSPKNEDSMLENAGSNNYTKFGRDLKTNVGSPYADGVAWCDEFVDWLFWKLGGTQAIMENLYGKSAYTPTSANYFKQHNAWYKGKAPKPGYQIFFKNSQRICHTGIVTKCENGYVHTIEGNTSSAAGVVANGGCVREKSYSVSYSAIAGYGIPACCNDSPFVVPKTNLASEVRTVQKFLNANYMDAFIEQKVFNSKLSEDGIYGKMTRHAILALWKKNVNEQFGTKLTLTNSLFGNQCLVAAGKCVVKYGEKGIFVLLVQMLLKSKGFYSGTLDGDFGPIMETGLRNYQVAKSLIVESSNSSIKASCTQQVWYSLFN